MAKSKKKKKPAGAKKPAYAKGKPPGQKSKSTAAKSSGSTGGGSKGGSKKSGAAEERPQQWNIIRQGSPEMKAFLFLLILVAAVSFLQYPYIQEQWQETYKVDKKDYPQKLKEFEKKYPTEKEQKENDKEKPVEPIKPTFQIFILNIGLTSILMMAMVIFLGINVQRRTDLKTPLIDDAIEGKFEASKLGDLAVSSAIWSVVALVPLTAGLLVTKLAGVPDEAALVTIPFWKQCLNHIYVAMNLQLMLVFLLVSSLVWLFSKYRSKLKLEPHWAAIATATLISLLYATMISIVPGEKIIFPVITGVAVSVSLVGILGYLYWKKGLEYSLLAGIISFGVTPLLASVII
ncbi:MAG: hypothetical protein JXA49_09295 [Actinobacteria bacterium]|nr:hypothetical protein [Actinomycetota bacterium]